MDQNTTGGTPAPTPASVPPPPLSTPMPTPAMVSAPTPQTMVMPARGGSKFFGIFLIIGILIAVLAAGALAFMLFMPQEQVAEEKMYRLGVLSGADFFAPSFDGFKEKMSALGYMEGENIMYDFKNVPVDFDQYRQVAQGFVDDGVDMIVAFPTEASLITKEVTAGTTIPIVFTIATVEGNDLVNSISAPGGNITGVHYPDVVGLALLRLEIMHEMLPEAKRIAVFHFPGYPIVPGQIAALRAGAPDFGIEIVPVVITDLANIEGEIATWKATSASANIDAVLMTDGPVAVTPPTFSAVAAFAAERHIPVGGMPSPAPAYEPLYSVLIDVPEAGRQAAVLADKILRDGTVAGTIPLPSAETLIVLNSRVAQSFNITIPEGLLERANEIIR